MQVPILRSFLLSAKSQCCHQMIACEEKAWTAGFEPEHKGKEDKNHWNFCTWFWRQMSSQRRCRHRNASSRTVRSTRSTRSPSVDPKRMTVHQNNTLLFARCAHVLLVAI